MLTEVTFDTEKTHTNWTLHVTFKMGHGHQNQHEWKLFSRGYCNGREWENTSINIQIHVSYFYYTPKPRKAFLHMILSMYVTVKFTHYKVWIKSVLIWQPEMRLWTPTKFTTSMLHMVLSFASNDHTEFEFGQIRN